MVLLSCIRTQKDIVLLLASGKFFSQVKRLHF